MSAWGAIAGGFVGTVVLTTALRAASELGLTRMDLPFLLGTASTADRTRAKALGFVAPLRRRAALRLCLLRHLRRHRPQWLGARSPVRSPARTIRRHAH